MEEQKPTSYGYNSHSKTNARDILLKPRSHKWRIWQQVRLLELRDWFFSVELTSKWRRHLVWSHCYFDKGSSGSKELLDIVTGRFASTQIFLSLLFAAEVGTYYSPSIIVTDVRNSLRNGPFEAPLEYCTGMMLIISIILTGSGVLANYIAFGVFRCVGQENAAMIFRSDIGLYAATLPSRLTFFSLITFFTWNVMFWWINVKDGSDIGAICLTLFTILCVGHVISTFSAMGRMVMNTSAMGKTPILPRADEETMLPHQLTNVLLAEAEIARRLEIPVQKQYVLNHYRSPEEMEIEPLTYEGSLRRRYPGIELEEMV